MYKMKIISGGQTGADQGGLIGATLACAPTGGWAPKGYRTDVGPMPSLAEFGLVESSSSDYRHRTGMNVADADLTLIIAEDHSSPGTKLTLKYCKRNNKRCLSFKPATGESSMDEFLSVAVPAIKSILERQPTVVVNIAGNREAKYPGIQARTSEMVRQLCFAINENHVDEKLENSLTESMRKNGFI